MKFIVQNKTNWKFLLIVIALAVIVGGGVLFLSRSEEVALLDFSPEEVEDEVEGFVPDEFEGWQTYRNEEYGFEVKYPGDWHLFKNITGPSLFYYPVFLRNPYTARLSRNDWHSVPFLIEVYEKPPELITRDWLFKGRGKDLLNIKNEKGVSGALKKAYAGESGLIYYAESIEEDVYFYEMGEISGTTFFYNVYFNKKKENFIYGLGIHLQFEENEELTPIPDREYIDIFNQMLSSFQFIESGKFISERDLEAAGWKIYRNEKYKYELKYPEEWFPSIVREYDFVFEISGKDADNILEIRTPLASAGSAFIRILYDEDVFIGDGIPASKKITSFKAGGNKICRVVIGWEQNEGGVIIYDYPCGPGSRTDYLVRLNQMLSTFRFIEEEKPITVIFPSEGEKIEAGKTYDITWSSNDIKNIIIVIIEDDAKAYLINKSVDASLGKFIWQVDETAEYVGKNNLKIVLYDSDYCGYIDESIGVECVKDEKIHSATSDGYFSVE